MLEDARTRFIINKELLSSSILIELLEKKRYGVEYQPIIDISNQNIYAFECLARFFDHANKSIPPDAVFASLHKSPLSLFQVEYEQKILQLSNAPDYAKVFVNLDQDSYFSYCTQGVHNPFLELFSNYQRSDIIIELIENSEINDSKMSLAIIDDLSKNKIKTAIDDVFNPQSMISTSVIQLANFIKLVLSHHCYVGSQPPYDKFYSLMVLTIGKEIYCATNAR